LFSLSPSTTSSTTNEENSLPSLRLTYAALFLLSAGTYIYIFSVTPVPFSQIFFSDINFFTWDKEVSGVAEGTALFLKWDEIFIVLGAAYWILLHFADLKREGRVKAGWGSILAAFVGVGVVCGPGAGMAVMWWWREEALAGGKDEGKEE
jgi:hypothetical protein